MAIMAEEPVLKCNFRRQCSADTIESFSDAYA
jgi:hypothetical protein